MFEFYLKLNNGNYCFFNLHYNLYFENLFTFCGVNEYTYFIRHGTLLFVFLFSDIQESNESCNNHKRHSIVTITYALTNLQQQNLRKPILPQK